MAEAMDVCSGLRSLREALRSCEEALQAERVRAAVLKEKAERALSDQRAQMSRADTLFEQLQTERARSKQLRGRLAETTDRLDTALAERAGLVGVVDKIKFEIHELRQSQTDLTCSAREKGASLKLEVLQLKERLRQAEASSEHMQATNDHLRQDLVRASNTASELRKGLVLANQHRKQLQAQMHKLQTEADDLLLRVASLRKDLATSQAQAAKALGETQATRARMATANESAAYACRFADDCLKLMPQVEVAQAESARTLEERNKLKNKLAALEECYWSLYNQNASSLAAADRRLEATIEDFERRFAVAEAAAANTKKEAKERCAALAAAVSNMSAQLVVSEQKIDAEARARRADRLTRRAAVWNKEDRGENGRKNAPN